MSQKSALHQLRQGKLLLAALKSSRVEGRIAGVKGLALDIAGLDGHLGIGDRVSIVARDHRIFVGEIVGFRGHVACALAFSDLEGVGPGCTVRIVAGEKTNLFANPQATISPDDTWIGRVISPLGEPLDSGGELKRGNRARRIRTEPVDAVKRARLGRRVDLGVAAINTFATCRLGQRLGLFSGSGTGKSTLIAMLARFAASDVIVLALVGERGREVREFIEDELGQEGLARAVIVVATSDLQPLMRRDSAYVAITIAEHFRDQGKSVFLLLDSITRFCSALREIALSSGEAFGVTGFPPSVFAELPRLLERAGPGAWEGDEQPGYITALFSVLVEGEDLNEPVSDSIRGILDGHIILDRQIAETGRYPAVDVLRSLSRTVPGCLDDADYELVKKSRQILATCAAMADIVRLGAYKQGTDTNVDRALRLGPFVETFLRQDRHEYRSLSQGFLDLEKLLEDVV